METYNFLQDVKQQLINALEDGLLIGKPVSEIHNEVYNMDYFVIGYYQAEQYLIQHEGVFNAIGEIKEYEENNFGEVVTDLSCSEKVCNMLAYIEGEKLINNLRSLKYEWNSELTEELQQEMLDELN